jgi:hypothetical protein
MGVLSLSFTRLFNKKPSNGVLMRVMEHVNIFFFWRHSITCLLQIWSKKKLVL